MPISADVREQLLNSFRAELAEHVQTMNKGLVAVEGGKLKKDVRRETLEGIFRAAHSLKGAARVVGASMVEQLAHALETLLDGLRKDTIPPTPALFNACYQAVDVIQVVQEAYESGQTSPPVKALECLVALQTLGSPTTDQNSVVPAPAVPETKETNEQTNGKDDWPGLRKRLDQTLALDPPAPASNGKEDPPSPGQQKTTSPTPPLSAPADSEHSAPHAGNVSERNNKESIETIRVTVDKVDALIEQFNELLVSKLHAEELLEQIKHIQEQVNLGQKEWAAVRGAYNRTLRRRGANYVSLSDATYADIANWRVRNTKFGTAGIQSRLEKDILELLKYIAASQEQQHKLTNMINSLTRRAVDNTAELALTCDNLESDIKRVRMLPLEAITASFGRMVRDLAQNAGKEVSLSIRGDKLELDKRIIEQIKDPLVHLLRNAVDHGIESTSKRMAAGKSSAGLISLTAEQSGQMAVIRVADDGAGLDLDEIRKSIARQNKDTVQGLNENELIHSIFDIGISTSRIITDISGRGIGLNVVRRNVEALQGRVDVVSTPGKGTTFTMTLPLAVTSSRSLLVNTAGETFLIPFNHIERILSVRAEEITTLNGQDVVHINDYSVTVVPLAELLELSPSNATDKAREKGSVFIVVVSVAERRMGLMVDDLAGEQDVVIKGFGPQLSRLGGIAGGAVMGDGGVVLVLNISDLMRLALNGVRQSVSAMLSSSQNSAAARVRRRILVVDDSITTRTLEKNILETVGYGIDLAIDGQEAWELILDKGAPDLVVADIAMPRLNGFELTKRIKTDERTAKVPVILVTSLDSPEDKARGIDAGADAYIIKSHFDQNNLLETIEQLL
ncbi:MAG TPA: hybrid sensor histidine kinase/response regulator [Anaerolineales bacterium]|nr:hybrid sensor histidine kinase/response regulator [Anaerolineales bacterium]